MAEMGPAENVVTFTNAELVLLWAENEHGQRACCNFFLRESLAISQIRDFVF